MCRFSFFKHLVSLTAAGFPLTPSVYLADFFIIRERKATQLGFAAGKRAGKRNGVEEGPRKGEISPVALEAASYLSGVAFLSARLSNRDLPQETVVCVQN